MSIFEGTVEAVSVKPSKYDESNFSHGYKINDSWYNIESSAEDKMANRGDKVKVETEGKELIRLKVVAKGEPPSLSKDGKPAYKGKSNFAGKTPYKKPIQEQVAISLLSIMNRATDLAIAQNDPRIDNVYTIAKDMSFKIVSLYGDEAMGLVTKVFASEPVALPATNVAKKATSLDKRIIAQKKAEEPSQNADLFDDDIPF